jgi:deoxycytidine triphosphate deaminase
MSHWRRHERPWQFGQRSIHSSRTTSYLKLRHGWISGCANYMIIPLRHWDDEEIVIRSSSDSTHDPVDHMLTHSDERVALDLHVGSSYQLDFHSWRALHDKMTLRPNACIRVLVDEIVETPPGVFGQICSKGAPSAEGLLVANQKVDPNFGGQLKLAVFNAGSEPVTVKRGAVFASLWFGRIDPKLDDRRPRRFASDPEGLTVKDRREAWRSLRPYVYTGIGSTFSAVAGTIIIKSLT